MEFTDGNNIAKVLAIILALTWWGIFAERHRFLGKLPGVVWIILTALLLSNLHLIPRESPVYDFVFQYMMPVGVPLLLYKTRIGKVLRESGKVLPIFFIGAIAVCVGSLLGNYLLDLGPMGLKVAATYTGAWTGGMVTMLAMSQITGMTPTEFSTAVSASAPVSVIGLLALISIPSIPFIRHHIPSAIIDAQTEEVANEKAHHVKSSFDPLYIAGSLGLGAVILWVAGELAKQLDIRNYRLFIITSITVVIANVFPKTMSKIEGDFDLGMMLMYVFFAAIGASTDATAFVKTGPILFAFGLIIIFTHLVLVLLVAKLLKLDLAEVIIGSGSNIIGAEATAGVASSKGWKLLVPPAIAVGMLAYSIGAFFGIAVLRILS